MLPATRRADVATGDGSTLATEAPESRELWARVWSWQVLRYRGSGWWLDRALPHSLAGFAVAVVALTLGWFGAAAMLTDDLDALLASADVTSHLWYLPLHLVCVRALGGLWAQGIGPSLDGLGLATQQRDYIVRGATGHKASVAALVIAAVFIGRDCWFGLTPDPATGLTPFVDPLRWDLGALGARVHVLLLAVWSLEWLLFGYILWIQMWILFGWTRTILRVDFRPMLGRILVGDGYRHALTLLARTTTVALVFALGNLLAIYLMGDLLPKDRIPIDGSLAFLQEMADLLSTTVLFVFVLGAAVAFVFALRFRVGRAVNEESAAAGNQALADLAFPLPLDADTHALRQRIEAQSGLLRAIAYQREVDVLGRRVVKLTALKSAAPLVAAAIRISRMF